MAVQSIPVTDRASWLALRVQDVTASDVAAVCGLDPYRSPLRVWAEKTGAIAGTVDDAVLRRGRWGEAAVVEAIRDQRPSWDLRRAGVYLRDTDLRLGATPDAVAADPTREGIGNVQCKTVRRDVFERDWKVLDESAGLAVAPIHYQLQTLAEAMLVGASWASVAALVMDAGGGWEFWEAPVARHEGAEARVRAAVARFWAEIEAGRQPAPDFTKDGDVIADLYAKSNGGEVDLSTHNRIALLCEEKLAWATRRTTADRAIEVIDAEITSLLGSAERGVHPAFNITWKTQKTGGYTVEPGTTRVLRITRKGGQS